MSAFCSLSAIVIDLANWTQAFNLNQHVINRIGATIILNLNCIAQSVIRLLAHGSPKPIDRKMERWQTKRNSPRYRVWLEVVDVDKLTGRCEIRRVDLLIDLVRIGVMRIHCCVECRRLDWREDYKRKIISDVEQEQSRIATLALYKIQTTAPRPLLCEQWLR